MKKTWRKTISYLELLLKIYYAAWAKGGVGMIITGNVMVDKLAIDGSWRRCARS